MLLMLTLTILQALVKFNTPAFAWIVVAVVRPVQVFDLVNIFTLKHALKRMNVLSRTFEMRSLWDDRSSSRHAPGQRHLRRRTFALVGDFVDDGVVE